MWEEEEDQPPQIANVLPPCKPYSLEYEVCKLGSPTHDPNPDRPLVAGFATSSETR